MEAALDDVEAGALPTLIVCHGMVIRAALSVRAGHWLPRGASAFPTPPSSPSNRPPPNWAALSDTPAPEAG